MSDCPWPQSLSPAKCAILTSCLTINAQLPGTNLSVETIIATTQTTTENNFSCVGIIMPQYISATPP